jgi:hypothetical protein
MTDHAEPRGAERLTAETGGKGKSNPLSYVADLFRLNLIADKVLGKEPLSRGSRESHFAESWVHAVGRYDEPDREDVIRLDRMRTFYLRIRELSPQEDGKHIETITRLLSPTPQSQVILGSPYDDPVEGPFDFLTKRDKKGR